MLEGLWWVSYGAIWLLAVIQVLAILALARQLGLLQLRLPPTGARIGNAGLELGDAAPPFREQDLLGRPVSLGVERRKPTLLVFLSPSCQACAQLAPAIHAFYRRERDATEIVLVSPHRNQAENQSFAERHGLVDLPFLRSPQVAEDYQVALTPYAILIDRAGNIHTKGMVNSTEHLESLLNALDEGVTSYDSKMNTLKASESGVG